MCLRIAHKRALQRNFFPYMVRATFDGQSNTAATCATFLNLIGQEDWGRSKKVEAKMAAVRTWFCYLSKKNILILLFKAQFIVTSCKI